MWRVVKCARVSGVTLVWSGRRNALCVPCTNLTSLLWALDTGSLCFPCNLRAEETGTPGTRGSRESRVVSASSPTRGTSRPGLGGGGVGGEEHGRRLSALERLDGTCETI